ncbi:hydrogenase maturation protease [Petrachloros mirabilis]
MNPLAPAVPLRVIGLGNTWRGDDAAGLHAVRSLRERLGDSADIIESEGDGLALLDLIQGVPCVILIDAVKGIGRPGDTIRLDLSSGARWGKVTPCSTHAMGITDAIELARVLGLLPGRLLLYGVELESVEPGMPLSVTVRKGLQSLVEQVIDEVANRHRTQSN